MVRTGSAHTTRRRKRTARWQLIRHILIGMMLFVGIAGVCIAIWHGTRAERVTIDTITISGGDTVPQSTVYTVVESVLEESYAFLIPHRFTLLYPHDAIVERIEQIPRIKAVEVTRERRELVITFREYVPSMVWCADEEDSCVLTDADGYAYTHAPALTGNQLIRYTDTTHAPTLGATAFTADVSEELRTFRGALLRDYGWQTDKIERIDETSFGLLLTDGREVRISTRIPIEKTHARLETLLDSDAYRHLTDGDFIYIDLRYGNRVFVEEEEVATTTPATTAPEEVE